MKNTSTIWIIAIVALLLLGFMPLFNGASFWGWCSQAMFGSNSYGYGMMNNYNYGGSMMGSWGFGWLFMLAILIALILLIIWLAQQIQHSKK